MQPDDLDRELSVAGDRARQSLGRAALPDRAFTAGLRDRLLNQLPTRPPVMDRGAPRTGWALDRLFRMPRLAPLALAAVLLMAAAVAARELYLAGLDPDPTPTPTPSVESTPSVTPEPSPDPTVTPTQAAVVEPSAAPAHTPQPTPVPTPKPTARPTPEPDPTPQPIGSLALFANGCNGGVVLGWSPFEGDGFNHYTTLRNTVANIPMAYPPQGGAVDFGSSYTTQVEKVGAVDASGSAGVTYYYRAMAFNSEDQVIAASPIVSAVPKPVKALGAMGAAPDAGGTRLTWTPYTGSAGCFTYYKIVYSETNPEPAYGTDPYLAAIGEQGESTYVTPDLASGTTYFIRVQAIRATHLGWIVTAQTDVLSYAVP
jgi:hypothetical protein